MTEMDLGRRAPGPAAAELAGREALEALYQRMLDGWNQGSASAFAAAMSEDADFVAFDGTHFTGRAQIEAAHRPMFETHLKGTRLTGKMVRVRFLSDAVAVVIARGGTIPRGRERAAPERDSIQTLVAVRCASEWRFASFQNTRVRPIGRNLGGTLHWLIGDRLWRLVRPRGD